MGSRIGFFGWVALGMVGGVVAGMVFDVPLGELPIWMIFGISFGMMFAFLFGGSSRRQDEDSADPPAE